MTFHSFTQRFTYVTARVYTALLRSSLGHCGDNALLSFPVRLDGPAGISIGAGVRVYSRAWLITVEDWLGQHYGGCLEIGENSIIGHGAQISAAKSVKIGKRVGIGCGAVIVDHLHDYRYPNLPILDSPLSVPKPVVVGDHAFIGVNALIAPGIRVGEHAFVGANAVVVRDVPPYTVVSGNPARVIRTIDPVAGISVENAKRNRHA
jgi:acetyltransferase-like isoleucine patch superfamily enzyme